MDNWFTRKDLKNENLSSKSKELIEILKTKKALLINNVQIKNLKELEKFSKMFGKLLNYGKKNYVEFKEVSLENELHYDGLSSKNKKKVPKYIFFFIKNAHHSKNKKLIKKGKFILLNSFMAAKDIPIKLKKKLMNKKLKFYGADTYLIPYPKPDQFTYQKPFFEKIKNKLNIRSHILSKKQGKLSKDKKFVVSTEGWKMCFSNSSGKETYEIFKELNKNILKKKNYEKIVFKNNDLLIVDNRYVFHGREEVSPPQKRHIIRLQVL